MLRIQSVTNANPTWQLPGMIVASAVFWMQYVDLKDRNKHEPRKLLLLAFLLGIVASVIALLLFAACDALGLPWTEGRENYGRLVIVSW